jgi:hypothetical protein
MKRSLILTCFVIAISITASAQLSVIGNNKPLSFLNPALQNYEMDKGVVSASYVINPFTVEENPANYLAIAEYKINENFRAGIHTNKVENRLNASTSSKAYLSYRLEMETGSYIVLGIDGGVYSDQLKTPEFNKVLSPNKFVYADTVATGFDLGFGLAYMYNGLNVGIGFSKLNKPPVVEFPEGIYEWQYDTVGGKVDSMVGLVDTTIVGNTGTFGLQSNINIIYEWDINENLELMHSLQLGNVDLTGMDYIGFQNILKINKRHSLGAGVFYNGYTGFIATAGYGISEKLKFEVTSFFIQDLNFNTTTRLYESDGFKPSLEFNLRFQF